MRDTSTLLPSAGRLSRSRQAVASRGGGRFCASPPQVRKSLRLRYGAVTSENGTPGDGSTGRGTGPAPRRTAKRQPAGTLSQARAAGRPRAAKTAAADRDQGNAVASESAVRPAAADGTGPAASASGPPAAGPRPTAPGLAPGRRQRRPSPDPGQVPPPDPGQVPPPDPGQLAAPGRRQRPPHDREARRRRHPAPGPSRPRAPARAQRRQAQRRRGTPPAASPAPPSPAPPSPAPPSPAPPSPAPPSPARAAGRASGQHNARSRDARHGASPSAGHGSGQRGTRCATRHT